MLETYEGGCHCGRVQFRVRADLSLVSECNCSICTKKGILHLTVSPEDFELLSGEDVLTTYQFNTNTAKHTFCKHCGIHAFNTPRLHPDRISVNARCLEGVDSPHCGRGSSTVATGRRRRGHGAPLKADKGPQALSIGAVASASQRAVSRSTSGVSVSRTLVW